MEKLVVSANVAPDTVGSVSSPSSSAAPAVPAKPYKAPRSESRLRKLAGRVLPPLIVFVLVVAFWEIAIRASGVKPYLFPKPSDIVRAVGENWHNLLISVRTTVAESVLGFVLSVVLGVAIAIGLALSKTVERSVYPYAIILQTIPIVAVAPIIVIWCGAGMNAIVVIAFLIAFFPILSNTLIGLNSTEANMKNLFYLYNATKWQTIWKLRLPAALPYIMAGMKISCSLSVVGAIVGEYVAGIGGLQGGLGYAITVASTRLQTAYLFACGLTAAVMGIVFFLLINALSNRLLRSWHDSAINN
ncbi:ABC transporter permease [Paenibacillus rhizovicinus]|uniref:ABC transporter permease n=1 Tax=Paenibacillus rhizovicinus TaxID=2704463 RepID=A0A6C0NTJ9_9BACL|nr:ABC transporter permease [Paenibacillus rhizovicinus]QHW29478.1 ABC transporter permease [Paenibacillus rhizovicinus]